MQLTERSRDTDFSEVGSGQFSLYTLFVLPTRSDVRIRPVFSLQTPNSKLQTPNSKLQTDGHQYYLDIKTKYLDHDFILM
jgi:hypothetical protein